MGVLSDAPQGLSGTICVLNQLPDEILLEMCQDVVGYLQTGAPFINMDYYDMNLSCLTQNMKPSCLDALIFIFKSAAAQKLSIESLVSELKSSMEWSDRILSIIQQVWKENGQSLCNKPKEPLTVGQLVSMDWKLGVSMSSSLCRSLNSPYISLRLNVAEPEGSTKQHSIEMSLSEFQNFAAQLKAMATTLETMS